MNYVFFSFTRYVCECADRRKVLIKYTWRCIREKRSNFWSSKSLQKMATFIADCWFYICIAFCHQLPKDYITSRIKCYSHISQLAEEVTFLCWQSKKDLFKLNFERKYSFYCQSVIWTGANLRVKFMGFICVFRNFSFGLASFNLTIFYKAIFWRFSQ